MGPEIPCALNLHNQTMNQVSDSACCLFTSEPLNVVCTVKICVQMNWDNFGKLPQHS